MSSQREINSFFPSFLRSSPVVRQYLLAVIIGCSNQSFSVQAIAILTLLALFVLYTVPKNKQPQVAATIRQARVVTLVLAGTLISTTPLASVGA